MGGKFVFRVNPSAATVRCDSAGWICVVPRVLWEWVFFFSILECQRWWFDVVGSVYFAVFRFKFLLKHI